MLLSFLILDILVCMKWYLVVLISISLKTMMLSVYSCAYWLFVYLPWRDVYSDPLPIFKLDYLSFYYWAVKALYVFETEVPYHVYDLDFFSPVLWVVFFTFLMVSYEEQNILNFNEVQLTFFFFSFVNHAFGYLRIFFQIQSHEYLFT